RVTGLMWQKTVPASGMIWVDARDYCAGLKLADHDDWRLPTVIELVSITEHVNIPAIDTNAFPQAPPSGYWTSSPWTGSSGIVEAWVVSLLDGQVMHVN